MTTKTITVPVEMEVEDGPVMFEKGKWYEVDTDDLDDADAEVFDVYTSANKIMRGHRDAMEVCFGKRVADRIPVGLEPRFAYRFGKISFSPEEPRERSTKSGGKVTI